ncbi:MAG TPA: peptidoglycan-binding domain-containing protein [Stellaceae bacterium]
MRRKSISTAAGLALCLIAAGQAAAADGDKPASDLDRLRSAVQGTAARAAQGGQGGLQAEIQDFLDQLDGTTHGAIKWEGADAFDARQDGDTAVVTAANARIAIRLGDDAAAKHAQVVFDRIEVRRAPAPDGATILSVAFPKKATLTGAEDIETTLSLDDATAKVVIDAQSGRARDSELRFSSARIEHKPTGDWVGFGPLSLTSKVNAAADGSWTAPADFELKGIEFFFTEGPVSGAIDRIAYAAATAGPDLAGVNRLRDRFDALRRDAATMSQEARLDALLDLLPGLPELFSLAKGELSVEKLAVRAATGEPLVALDKASLGGSLAGLSGDSAAWRITLRHEGLSLASAILPASKVPQRVVVDFGLEDVATGPLRAVLQAAAKMREGAAEEQKQRAMQQMLAAAAKLNPTFRIYDAALDTPDTGIDANAEAKGSPLAPKGYTAAGDVTVRGFDKLPELVGDQGFARWLPLLKEIGTSAAGEGAPRLKYHLASAPQKWLAVNGSDVTGWFADNAGPGQPRSLRPAEPPLEGEDVRAVQQALVAAGQPAPQTGLYDGATAAAVARFQKKSGLNVDGVVDDETRQKLGVKPAANGPAPEPHGPAGRPPGR